MKRNKFSKLVTCDNCGVEFECVHKDRINNRKHIFCSKKCEGEYIKNHNPNYMKCEVCGKLIYVKPRDQKRFKHITCSYECMGKLRKTTYLGTNNPNYGNTGFKNPLSVAKRISNYGYVLLKMPDHPMAMDGGWIKEHRFVAEQFLMTNEQSISINGVRCLSKKYDVHHIDGNRTNNDVANLQILTRSEHSKLHQKKKHLKFIKDLGVQINECE